MIRLFRVSIPASVLVAIAGDFILIFGVLLLCGTAVMNEEFSLFLLFEDGLVRLLAVPLSMVLAFYFQNLYSEFSIGSKAVLLKCAIAALGVTFIVQSLIAYIYPSGIAPRSILLPGGALLCILFPLWRFGFATFFVPAFRRSSVLFLGMNSLAQEIASSMQVRPELGMRPIGFVGEDVPVGTMVGNLRVVGTLADFSEVVKRTRPDCIVVGLQERRRKLPVEELLRLRLAGVKIEEAATTFQTAFSRIPTRALHHSQLIFSSELAPLPRNLRIQTIYSVTLAAIALTLAAPVMILVALAVRLTSRGPILFRQTRIGMRGEQFRIYKFRSMRVDAEAGTGAVWASRNDPRVTAIGGFLRKTRLDELPQLFNVIRREMSIVGPRPERPEFVGTLSELIPFYAHRHSVKPGITGWAQINYKYGETIEDAVVKLEYDMYYIKNLSPELDFYIMLHTLKAMVSPDMGQ